MSDPTPRHPSAIQEQLTRILESREFKRARRMSRFLEVVVNETLAGRGDSLKEHFLGITVFDRPESFDPNGDPLVRVEARRLRSKLRDYYAGAGAQDAVRIHLPTGQYAVEFSTPGAGPSVAEAKAIAVLPLTDLSATPDGALFSDGLTWEITHRLTRIAGLKVIAWNSANQFRDATPDLAAIRARLPVGYLLTGSVRRNGERVRIVVQLIEAATGAYLWSETYDRHLDAVVAVQDEIASAVSTGLHLQLLGPAAARPPVAYCPEAFSAYLRGRAEWGRRTAAGIWLSRDHFCRALELDKDFALGHAGLADAYALLADYGLMSSAEAMPPARDAARRALELNPGLGEAHTTLGLITGIYSWDWPAAAGHYERALAANPGYATAHHWLACDYYAPLGRFADAHAAAALAEQLDPLSMIIRISPSYLLMLEGRFAESLALDQQWLASHPDVPKIYMSLGRTLIQLGRPQEALEYLEGGLARYGRIPSLLGALGQAAALAGNPARARAVLMELDELASTQYVPAVPRAMIHLGLRERDRALDWLEDAGRRRETSLAMLAVHPAYQDLRQQPRYRDLVALIGLT